MRNMITVASIVIIVTPRKRREIRAALVCPKTSAHPDGFSTIVDWLGMIPATFCGENAVPKLVTKSDMLTLPIAFIK